MNGTQAVNSIGARAFSPEITAHIIGTEVLCPDRVSPHKSRTGTFRCPFALSNQL